MKKITFFLFLFILLNSFNFAFADLYFPSACEPNEEYFQGGTINPSEYSDIRSVDWIGEKGFCVDRREYCFKNSCGSAMIVKIFETKISSPFFHIKNIILNLIINFAIIFFIYVLSKNNLRLFYKVGSVARIALLTILGYVYDYLGILAASFTFLIVRIKIMKIPIFPHQYENYEILANPFSIAIATIFIFLLVSITFYFLYSKLLANNKGKRVLYSCFFGILSNPLWFIMLKLYLLL